jgi:hypothetical protein
MKGMAVWRLKFELSLIDPTGYENVYSYFDGSVGIYVLLCTRFGRWV